MCETKLRAEQIFLRTTTSIVGDLVKVIAKKIRKIAQSLKLNTRAG